MTYRSDELTLGFAVVVEDCVQHDCPLNLDPLRIEYYKTFSSTVTQLLKD